MRERSVGEHSGISANVWRQERRKEDLGIDGQTLVEYLALALVGSWV